MSHFWLLYFTTMALYGSAPFPARGIIYQGKVYALDFPQNKLPPDPGHGVMILRADLQGDPRKSLERFDPADSGWSIYNKWFQLTLFQGCLWFTNNAPNQANSSRIPLADLVVYGPDWVEIPEVIKLKYPRSWKTGGYHGWYINPVADAFSDDIDRDSGIPFGPSMKKNARFHSKDVVPYESTRTRAFLLLNDKSIEVWDGGGGWEVAEDNWLVLWSARPVETFRVPFRENFHAYMAGEDYYFLTRSGQLYLARQPKKGEKRQVEAVWGDYWKPITAVLQDGDTGQTYFFGHDRLPGGKEGFFFPLGDRPNPRRFRYDELRPVRAPESLRVMLQYAQVLPGRAKEKAGGKEKGTSSNGMNLGDRKGGQKRGQRTFSDRNGQKRGQRTFSGCRI